MILEFHEHVDLVPVSLLVLQDLFRFRFQPLLAEQFRQPTVEQDLEGCRL